MTEESITDVLFNKGTLIDLHVGKPTFQKKLRQADILATNIDEDVIYLGHKKLLPPSATKELTTLEGRGRMALADRSLPFPIEGTRFVHIRTLPDVLTQLSAIRDEWNEEVGKLVLKYPELVEKQLIEFDTQCKQLRKNELLKFTDPKELEKKEKELDQWMELQRINNRMMYPDRAALPALFKFQWRMFKISPADGFAELDKASQEDLAHAQVQLKQELRNWVKEASADIHRTLGEAAANAASILASSGKLNARSIKPLFDAFDTFSSVDFAGSSDFRRVIDDIRKRFGQNNRDGLLNYSRTADAVNESDVGKQAFTALLKNVAALAEDTVAAEAGIKAVAQAGEFGRVLDI